MSAGIDPARDLIPIAPAEHYHMGGVAVDARGHASLAGLWVIGECAATGVHGANRLASNSLLEAVVFAARVAQDIAGMVLAASARPALERAAAPPASPAQERGLRDLMARGVGVQRDQRSLAYALGEIARLEHTAPSPALRNLATSALMIAAAACARRESRGAHFRRDFPLADAAQARRTMLTLAEARAIAESAAQTEPLAAAAT
jgi:L-aspartate oxidase